MNRSNLINKIKRQSNITTEQATRALGATLQGLVTITIPPAPDTDAGNACDSDDIPTTFSIFAMVPGGGGDFAMVPGGGSDAKKVVVPPEGGENGPQHCESTIDPPALPRGESLSAYVARFAGIPQPTAKIVIALILSAFTVAGVLDG